MAVLSTLGREGPTLLAEQAAQFEKLAPLMRRPDGRAHMLERAAECRAKAALIQAAHQWSTATEPPRGRGRLVGIEGRSRWT